MNEGPNRTEIEELRSEVERLRALQDSRADAAAAVTHQLKTPLTSVLGYIHIMRTRNDVLTDEQRTEFLEVIERQGQRILALIEDMLASQRIEGDVRSLQRVPVDLAELAARVADEFSTARGRTITVTAPDRDLGLWGDPAAIEHVLTNLLDNALKFSPAHEPVSITISEADRDVVFAVTDRGKGIPEEDLSHIFERFRQASNARGRGSVGLGLHIASTLVHAMGGRIWVESPPDAGATFTVALRRRQAR